MRFLALVLLAVLATGCDGITRVSGRVVDEEGKPIPDAKVVMSRGGSGRQFDTTSNADGCFETGGTHAPGWARFDLVVRKEGFKDDKRRLAPNNRYDSLNIVLERDSKEPVRAP